MNVALIIERIEPWRGGAETSTLRFAECLARHDCRVTVLTTSLVQSRPDLTMVPLQAGRSLRSARTLAFAKRAADHVRSRRYDVVHAITPALSADVYQPRGGTIPETLARNVAIRESSARRGLKRVGQALNLKYRALARMESRLLGSRPAPWVVAISDYVADQLQRHYALDPARVVRVYNGVDPDLSTASERELDATQVRRQYHISPDDLLVLCVAHNFKLKGVARLIEALARPAASTYRALIVGRDNVMPYARLAERLGVSDRVIFSGATTRISSFFHAADVLAHPTYYDPCSRVVLEALAAGLPCITTRYNGAAERITDGVNGYTVPEPADTRGLAEALARLADDDHRAACAANAAASVADCTMENHARQIRDLYERIVRDRS